MNWQGIAMLIVGALVSGAFSALVTVTALRVDMRWMKRALNRLEARVDAHDGEIRQLQLDRS